MKIAFLDIDNTKNPFWGSGQATATKEIAKRLALKHSVMVYTSKYKGYKDYTEENVSYKHIGYGTNNPMLNNIIFLLSVPFTVAKIQSDILFEHFTAPISTCFSPLFTKIPIVAITSFFASDILSKKYKLNFMFVTKIGAKLYTRVIALNADHAKSFKELNPKTLCYVIPNGVDQKYFSLPTEEEDYVLFLGRIDINQKGLDLLLQAFSQLDNKFETKLVIAGKGDSQNENELREMINALKLDKKIVVTGKISGKKKDTMLKNCKLVVMPSRYEGHSLTALEACAVGKPIVCFDIGGFDWLPKNSCVKVKAFSVIDYTKQLKKLLSDKQLRQKLSENAKKNAMQYTWDTTVQRYEQVIQEVYEKKG